MSKYLITTAGGLGNQMMNYCLWHYLTFVKGKQAVLYPTKDVAFNKIFSNTQKISFPKWYINWYIAITTRFVVPVYMKCMNLLHLKQENILLKFPIKVVEFLGWENYHFIGEIHDLQEIFRFPQLDSRNLEVANLMRTSDSVSIHVRRGDYQNNVFWRLILGDICDEKYYEDAILKVEQLFSNPKYFIFSDDIEWVKLHLKIKNALYIDWNIGEDSYKDMQLISNCRCNICANSTFSLMSSWLNCNSDPIRIVPVKWMNQFKDSLFARYIPNNGWIAIDNTRPIVSIHLLCNINKKQLNRILNQTYSDFEILTSQNGSLCCTDERVKNINTSSGMLTMKVNDCDLFRDRKYLQTWVEEQLYLLISTEYKNHRAYE